MESWGGWPLLLGDSDEKELTQIAPEDVQAGYNEKFLLQKGGQEQKQDVRGGGGVAVPGDIK